MKLAAGEIVLRQARLVSARFTIDTSGIANENIISDYRQFVQELKARVLSARISTARAITHEAILLYWDIGQGIVEKQKEYGWGEAVVELIATDLQRAFPGTKGFSP